MMAGVTAIDSYGENLSFECDFHRSAHRIVIFVSRSIAEIKKYASSWERSGIIFRKRTQHKLQTSGLRSSFLYTMIGLGDYSIIRQLTACTVR